MTAAHASRRWLAPLLAAVLACSSSQPTPTRTVAVTATPDAGAVADATPAPRPPEARTADAPFRAQAPEPQPTPPFIAPLVEQFRLPNGMPVFLVERRGLPIVVVRFVSRRGGDDVPVARAGVAELTGALLDQGTRTRNALQLSDAFASIGADAGSWMGWDSAGGYVKALTPQLPRALELLADVIQRPSFPQEEFALARDRHLALIRQQQDSPRTIAGLVAARVVYGDEHPYGRPFLGTQEALQAATRDAVLETYRAHFVTPDSALVVVGDVRRATIQPLLTRHFGAWRVQPPGPRPPLAPPPTASGARLFLVERRGAPQSFVVLAHPGVSRDVRDYPAILVMNAILGGMFSSRLNLNLREQHAYTYGARSGFAFRRGPGPFSMGGAIVAPATAPAIREMLNELNRMRTSDVTDNELAAAKVSITDSLPARFETADAAADALSEIYVYGLPMDEYGTIVERVRAVTAADVHRVAEALLHPDQARIVVVGDRSVVEPGLRELNLGPIEVRGPLGDPPNATPPPSPPTPPTGG